MSEMKLLSGRRSAFRHTCLLSEQLPDTVCSGFSLTLRCAFAALLHIGQRPLNGSLVRKRYLLHAPMSHCRFCRFAYDCPHLVFSSSGVVPLHCQFSLLGPISKKFSSLSSSEFTLCLSLSDFAASDSLIELAVMF